MSMARRTYPLVAVASAGVVILSGCAIDRAEPISSSTPSPTAEVTTAPEPDPVYVPDGGATANQAYFDFVNARLVQQNPAADGRAFVDSLVTAGFDRVNMELTPDITPANEKADSITFSVRFDDGCLIGQYVDASQYLSQVRAALGTGRCLVGQTRPIDW